jgi:alkaline phosphatase
LSAIRDPHLRVASLARALAMAAALAAALVPGVARSQSAIFLHPDGMGANTWAAVRLLAVGPDGRLAWDRLPDVAVYVGPMLDRVTASSNGGATSHAWGVRADTESYGTIGGRPIARALSGSNASVMIEAQRAGKRIALVNSSSVTEPGTGAFLAQVADPDDDAGIALQILAAGPDIVLGGGESWFLPKGARGVHGAGQRSDGRDLVAEARRAGYVVVHTAEELAAVPAGTRRLLGLFAADHTYNEGTERSLARSGRPVFQPQAPRFDAMIAKALAMLADAPNGFLLVGNEEATDNLAGDNHGAAVLESGRGADRAIAAAIAAADRDPRITIVVASDSDCGGLQVVSDDLVAGARVPARAANGAPIDGDAGRPFLAAPDRAGVRLPFVLHWANDGDLAGGIVARGRGPGARLIEGTIDSTDVYRALYLGLFGRDPAAAGARGR